VSGPRYEPFSQRLHELRRQRLFHEEGFQFLPLKIGEHVAGDIRASDLQPPRNRHWNEAETYAERQGIREKTVYDVIPELHDRFFDVQSRKDQAVREHVRRFLASPDGRRYAESNPPARLLWDALDGVEKMHAQIRQLESHFPDFHLDLSLGNVLFRGFNAKGEPILSVIDQNYRGRHG